MGAIKHYKAGFAVNYRVFLCLLERSQSAILHCPPETSETLRFERKTTTTKPELSAHRSASSLKERKNREPSTWFCSAIKSKVF
jgi:hypothetical protein